MRDTADINQILFFKNLVSTRDIINITLLPMQKTVIRNSLPAGVGRLHHLKSANVGVLYHYFDPTMGHLERFFP
jgi:hypothetical protein